MERAIGRSGEIIILTPGVDAEHAFGHAVRLQICHRRIKVSKHRPKNYSALSGNRKMERNHEMHADDPSAVAPSTPKRSPCVERFAKPENLERPVSHSPHAATNTTRTKSGESSRKESPVGAAVIMLFIAGIAVWFFVRSSDRMAPAATSAHDEAARSSTPASEPARVSTPHVDTQITPPVITQPAITQPATSLKPQGPSERRLRWNADIQRRLEENEATFAKLKERFNRGVAPGYYTEVYNEEVTAAEKKRAELAAEISRFNLREDAPSRYNEK